jgi:acetaldehyde dehydrogenase/alcohol dehydrogenase
MFLRQLKQFSKLNQSSLVKNFSQKDTIESVNQKMKILKEAQQKFLSYSQEQVDNIFKKTAHHAAKHRVPLAKFAVRETKLGQYEDKVLKNSAACELVLSKYEHSKTVGIIEYDKIKLLTKIAVPAGPIASILPVTNPTSTTIAKTLMALKTRNGVMFIPHPRAADCSAEAVRVCLEGAVNAGAPEGILQCVNPTSEITNYIMHHPDIKMLLATGGPAMVKACYASGKPSLGVGAGNAAILIDETADLDEAVGNIVLSKTFDNGVICASEQSVVLVDSVYENCKEKFEHRGVHFLYGEERQKLSNFLLLNGHINIDIIGQSAQEIAKRIGVKVPSSAVVLAAECTEVGPTENLSHEKLSPVLSFYRAKTFDEALDLSKRIVLNGGEGHTAAIYSKKRDRLELFSQVVPACHLLSGMPTALGAIGSSYNFHVDPSLTLGVGSLGGSSLSGSLTPFHLLDIRTLCEKQEHMEWYKNPPSIYFNRNCTEDALGDLAKAKDLKRALIITDKMMVQLGHAKRIQDSLESHGFKVAIFDEVLPDPNMECVRHGVRVCHDFKPDTLICLGGGSPMDAGKFIRVQYETPDLSIDDLAARFIELRKRTQEFPQFGSKIKKLVCIPTTSGTASEVTPFSVVTDDQGHKLPLFSYSMTPDMAIVDSSYCDQLPKSLVAFAGLDAITHAVESYVSVAANHFTMPNSLRATKLLFDNLETSYKTGCSNAREQVHHGATVAGLAFSNAFLGICHSLSHKVGGKFHTPHGLTNSVLLPYVIEYNANPRPTRQAPYPTYTKPVSMQRYAELGRHIGLKGDSDEDLAMAFANKFVDLAKSINVPLSFKDCKIDETQFLNNIENIAEDAFDDQCTPANPRFPLTKELEEILKKAYYGEPLTFKY